MDKNHKPKIIPSRTDEPLRYEIWPIHRLKPNPKNPRRHSPEQISQLADSIREFGFTRPLVVDEANTLLAGHGAWLAAQEVGMTDVPVVVRTGLTDQQKRAYLIADNQLALNSSWDEERLRSEIDALERELFDLKLVGFSPEELDRILADLAPEHVPIEEEAIPSPSTLAVTKPGDLWIVGRHRVLCADTLASETMPRLLQQSLADMSW
jgi:ParB-like chromosome segregation protein Spo0J